MSVATHTAYLWAQFSLNARVGADPCSFKLACRTRFFSNSNGNEHRRKRLVVTAKVRRNLPRRLIAPKRVFEEDPNICPCGGAEGQLKLRYEECCKPYHDGQLIEPDALTLARTRYTAYAKGQVDYIVKTIHPEYPELQAKGVEKLTEELNLMCPRIHFTKFDIFELEGATETQVPYKRFSMCAKSLDEMFKSKVNFMIGIDGIFYDIVSTRRSSRSIILHSFLSLDKSNFSGMFYGHMVILGSDISNSVEALTQVCITFKITFTYRVVKQYREILKKKVIFVKEGKRWFFRGPVVQYKPNRLKNKLAEEEKGIFD